MIIKMSDELRLLLDLFSEALDRRDREIEERKRARDEAISKAFAEGLGPDVDRIDPADANIPPWRRKRRLH